MANMTLALPDKLQEKMRQHKEIRWREVARKSFEEKILTLEEMDKIAQKSKLTKKDIEELSHLIKKETYEDLKKKFSLM